MLRVATNFMNSPAKERFTPYYSFLNAVVQTYIWIRILSNLSGRGSVGTTTLLVRYVAKTAWLIGLMCLIFSHQGRFGEVSSVKCAEAAWNNKAGA